MNRAARPIRQLLPEPRRVRTLLPGTRILILTGFGLALVVLAAVGIRSYRSTSELVEISGELAQSHAISRELERLFALLLDAGNAQRGFVITHDTTHLRPVALAAAEVPTALARLRELGELEPSALDTLGELASRRLDIVSQVVEIGRRGDFETATARIVSGEGTTVMNEIREVIDSLDLRQTARTGDRAAEAELAARETIRVIAGSSILAVVLLGIAALVIDADLRARMRAELALRASEEDLRRAAHAAEAANVAKSEFLARMSHELRTPLNSVIGFSNILLKNKSGNLSDQDVLYLERVAANGKHLLALINSILDLSKIEARKVDLDVEEVDLGALVGDVAAGMASTAEEGGVELAVHVPEGLQPLWTDPGKLRQVLINLIGNAVKFTPGGRVDVRVVAAASTGRAERIEVRDTGIGIPPDRLEGIFDAFEQADTSTTRRFGGTGLGLAISRSLAELLGFDISATSTPGTGSTFTVLLRPREKRQAEASSPGQLAVPAAASGRSAPTPSRKDGRREGDRLVLVIDDEADARQILIHHVEEHGSRAVAVATGEEGLEAARALRPDLITLDLLMPGMSGWQVLRALKGDPEVASIPVVIVSVVAGENRARVRAVVDPGGEPGAAGVLNKGSELETELGPMLHRLLGG